MSEERIADDLIAIVCSYNEQLGRQLTEAIRRERNAWGNRVSSLTHDLKQCRGEIPTISRREADGKEMR